MQEATGEIRELTSDQLLALATKEREQLNESLVGFIPLNDGEHKAMLELPVSDRPSELSWSRYQDNVSQNQLADITLAELYTDGFKAARKIYEGK